MRCRKQDFQTKTLMTEFMVKEHVQFGITPEL